MPPGTVKTPAFSVVPTCDCAGRFQKKKRFRLVIRIKDDVRVTIFQGTGKHLPCLPVAIVPKKTVLLCHSYDRNDIAGVPSTVKTPSLVPLTRPSRSLPSRFVIQCISFIRAAGCRPYYRDDSETIPTRVSRFFKMLSNHLPLPFLTRLSPSFPSENPVSICHTMHKLYTCRRVPAIQRRQF